MITILSLALLFWAIHKGWITEKFVILYLVVAAVIVLILWKVINAPTTSSVPFNQNPDANSTA